MSMKKMLKIGKTKKSSGSSKSEVEAPVKKKKKVVAEVATSKKSKPGKKKSSGDKAKKKKVAKPLPEFKVLKKKMNRSMLLDQFVKEIDFEELLPKAELSERDQKKIAKAFMEAQQRIIFGHIGQGGSGKIQIPGLLNIMTKHVPARKGGEKKKNPFKPGEFVITKAKEASTKVKVRPMKLLKDVANG